MPLTMEYTKDVILALLYAPDEKEDAAPVRGRTRLMKMLFLLKMQHGFDGVVHDFYDFQPYKFGPFSPQVYQDVEFLENVGVIGSRTEDDASLTEASETQEAYEDSLLPGDTEDMEQGYTEPVFALTNKGREKAHEMWNSLTPQLQEALTKIKKACNSIPLTALLRYVYKQYPAFASKSELEWLR